MKNKTNPKPRFDRNNKPGSRGSSGTSKSGSSYSDYRKKSPKKERGDDDLSEDGYRKERSEKKSFVKKKPFDRDSKPVKSKFKKEGRDNDDEFGGEYRKKGKSENYSRPYKKKEYSKSTGGKRQTPKSTSSSLEGIRLNKYISNAGICSRREADDLIRSGVVSVNGKVITEMGFRVKPTDIINYGGQTLKKEKMVYLILNKPKDYITTADDPQKRKTVLELIHGACRERIYPVGRLDRATTGLLLFTNDGELTKKLTHPRYGVRKIYHVELDKPLKFTDLKTISEGVELEDGEIKPDEVTYVGDGSNKKEIGIELHSGKNRIVRRLFEHLGYNVRKLDRVMFGPLTKKDLPRGRWRFLTEAEVGMLKMVSNKAV